MDFYKCFKSGFEITDQPLITISQLFNGLLINGELFSCSIELSERVAGEYFLLIGIIRAHCG